ncbi:MAG: 2-C-methyl-D-erythritol 4-phosphate cytidylyltransferase [Gracilibacteraceae bacterium]|jgi:2-C-methyl-D-erythritol 4-phosphate cytidylyltransferase|nr:2-C-methyl-D-erythritol 4-phosphate cytidylyltransferase [Gracilibacteraceae bacterium]
MDIDAAATAAIIPAAGRGLRLSRPVNKLFLPLGGVPVIVRVLRVFESCGLVGAVLVAAAAADAAELRRLIKTYDLRKPELVPGGAERQFSVGNALRALDPSVRRVVVHDGARPLLTEPNLAAFLRASRGMAAAVAALPVSDTIKETDGQGRVKRTLPRRDLCAVQTPQVFARDLLTAAHEAAAAAGDGVGTDDAALVERWGGSVCLLPGWEENIKITTEIDLLLAETILRAREENSA